MKFILFGLALFSTIVLAGGAAFAQSQYSPGSVGTDVSWPNCKSKIGSSAFGIVGVSDGTGYSTNGCLSKEAGYFKNNLSFYVNTGWNSSSIFINPTSPRICATGDENCMAYNYGYNAGIYAYDAANNQGLSSNTWWLDVETSNTWSSSTTQNMNSLQGEYDALMAKKVGTVGIYSTTAQWQTLTGGWKNNWPSWGATTWNTAAQARTYCTGHEFTGGPSYLMQFLPKRSSLDQDVAC